MKVKVFETVDIDTEVSVDVNDIRAMLVELESDVDIHNMTAGGHVCGLGELLNAAYSCLKSPTDEMIATLSKSNRENIAKLFREQADRYGKASQSE